MTRDEFSQKYGKKVLCKIEIWGEDLEQYLPESFDEKKVSMKEVLNNIGCNIEDQLENNLGGVIRNAVSDCPLFQEPPKKEVIVEIYGGVADVTSKPDDVEVRIIDHDNHDSEEETAKEMACECPVCKQGIMNPTIYETMACDRCCYESTVYDLSKLKGYEWLKAFMYKK